MPGGDGFNSERDRAPPPMAPRQALTRAVLVMMGPPTIMALATTGLKTAVLETAVQGILGTILATMRMEVEVEEQVATLRRVETTTEMIMVGGQEAMIRREETTTGVTEALPEAEMENLVRSSTPT